MATARFLHAADLHLGSPLKSLGTRVSAEVHAMAKKQVNTVFQNLVNVAKSEQVDFVVLAGDIYDTADRDPGAQIRVNLGLRELSEAGIKVFLVHGNHDPLTPDYLSGRSLPDGVTVFPAGEVTSHIVTMSNGAQVTVAGISYKTAAEENNLARLFQSITGQTIVGVLHTNVGGNNQHGNYAPCSSADLQTSPVNYWALGHIHDRQVHETPKGYWAYPGNLQGRSTKATECGAKGVLIIDVHEDGSLEAPRFVPCDALRFQRLSVDLSAVTDLNDVSDIAIDALQEAVDAADGRSLMVRLEFIGSTLIYSDFAKKFNELQESILTTSPEIMGNGAVIKIRQSCRPLIDLAIERGRGTLLGDLLVELDRKTEEEVSDDLRSVVELLLVNALEGGK
jgi:DNA repair exonuclease SbcCD nuclease subunit